MCIDAYTSAYVAIVDSAIVQVAITLTHVVFTLTLKFPTDFIVHQPHPVLGSKKSIVNSYTQLVFCTIPQYCSRCGLKSHFVSCSRAARGTPC